MQRYTYSLGGATGNTPKVRVHWSSAGPQEEMAFDDINVTGELAATCGDGVVEGSEVCDDGDTDACGSCNADCTGAGSGSSCGDGALCPETEACDDGYTDACGSCNATCDCRLSESNRSSERGLWLALVLVGLVIRLRRRRARASR